ncbi:MAG: hypothetical protein GY863_15750 [bacterium]|nr:hypothetical protein [bacterium]
MCTVRRLFPVIMLGLLLICCSGGTAISTRGFQKSMGDHLRGDIVDQSTKLFAKHGFELERQEGADINDAGDIYVETRWKDRLPFDEEKSEGIVAVRTKIVIRARRTQKVLNFTTNQVMFRVTYVMEHEFMVGLDREWVKRPFCPKQEEYCHRIYDEYRSQLRFTKGE